jgi:hypothetical protein
VDIWPQVVTKIIGFFAILFDNDRMAPKDPNERLKWHQEKSGPIMEEIKSYCNGLLENKVVEPNCSLGKEIAFGWLRKSHWRVICVKAIEQASKSSSGKSNIRFL